MDVSAPTARNMTHATLPDPQNRITGKADVQDAVLHQAADAFETHFLAEMLKSAGLGQARESFGGGVGEEQFGSLDNLATSVVHFCIAVLSFGFGGQFAQLRTCARPQTPLGAENA